MKLFFDGSRRQAVAGGLMLLSLAGCTSGKLKDLFSLSGRSSYSTLEEIQQESRLAENRETPEVEEDSALRRLGNRLAGANPFTSSRADEFGASDPFLEGNRADSHSRTLSVSDHREAQSTEPDNRTAVSEYVDAFKRESEVQNAADLLASTSGDERNPRTAESTRTDSERFLQMMRQVQGDAEATGNAPHLLAEEEISRAARETKGAVGQSADDLNELFGRVSNQVAAQSRTVAEQRNVAEQLLPESRGRLQQEITTLDELLGGEALAPANSAQSAVQNRFPQTADAVEANARSVFERMLSERSGDNSVSQIRREAAAVNTSSNPFEQTIGSAEDSLFSDRRMTWDGSHAAPGFSWNSGTNTSPAESAATLPGGALSIPVADISELTQPAPAQFGFAANLTTASPETSASAEVAAAFGPAPLNSLEIPVTPVSAPSSALSIPMEMPPAPMLGASSLADDPFFTSVTSAGSSSTPESAPPVPTDAPVISLS
ncbi:MAG: hypothetical protein KDA85_04085, partial [Planctomycetaceae bacterium]|nr:hypothetical protein [Planctomycetaceae bacterium]